MDTAISVVIPTFNREHLIEKTINSVFSQDQSPDEIIVLDDGSTDGTCSLVEMIAARATVPVQLLRQENSGPGRARNMGAQASRGAYVLFLDSDDILLPGSMLRFRRALREHGPVHMAYGGRVTLLPNGKRRRTIPPPLHSDNWRNFEDELLSRRPTVGLGAAVIRRDFALAYPFPEEFRICEDLAFFARALLHGRCTCFPEAQVEIDQQTHHAFRDAARLMAEHEKAYAHALLDLPDTAAKRRLQRSLRAYPALRTFRELHRAGLDRLARPYYWQALALAPKAALNLSYARKFLRGLLGLRHPASQSDFYPDQRDRK